MPSAVINRSTSGAGTAIIPAKANHIAIVTSFFLIAAGTVNATWEDETTGTDRTGPLPLIANSGVSASSPDGLFEFAVGKAGHLNLGGNIQVSGAVTYKYRFAA